MTAVAPILSGQPSDASDAIDQLMSLIGSELELVNRQILDRMDSRVAMIPKLAEHIVSSGGKRLRPILTLAIARMLGYDEGTRHVHLAACVEFIHTATLLHDDVVDESALRRGKATANAIYGNKASVLVGDFLFARAFELMVEDGGLEVLDILSSASATIAEGEVLQLIAQHNLGTTEDQYLDIIASKTAALFAAAAKVGAVCCDCSTEDKDLVYTYGQNLGIAFQLVDDALDYSARQADLGKTVGDDFQEGKITLPVLVAFHKSNDEEKAFWKRTIRDCKFEEGDLDHAISLINKHHGIEETIERARGYGNKAQAALAGFPKGPMHSALHDLIDFCIQRGY